MCSALEACQVKPQQKLHMNMHTIPLTTHLVLNTSVQLINSSPIICVEHELSCVTATDE